eukprot:jgi/Botrbrau1/1624/Bobra.0185s0039.1
MRKFPLDPDWGFINWLACIFDSLDIRRDGTVQAAAFLARLAGYNPVLTSNPGAGPSTSSVAQERPPPEADPSARSAGQRTLQLAGSGVSVYTSGRRSRRIKPGTTRLSGAGYMHRREPTIHAPQPPALNDLQKAIFDRTNQEVERLMALHANVFGQPLQAGVEPPASLVQLTASGTGCYQRPIFIQKLVEWKLADIIRAEAM